MEFDDVLTAAKPHQRTVTLVMDGALEDERTRLEDKLSKAEDGDKRAETVDYQPQAPAIARQILDLQKRAKESKVEFTFQSIGRRAWSDLVAKHPATKAQIDLAQELDREPLDYDIDTFPIAAMAASLVDPKGVNEDKLRRLEERLSEGQWRRLWVACLGANLGHGDVGESVAAFAVVKGSTAKSKRPSESERQDPSSSEGS